MMKLRIVNLTRIVKRLIRPFSKTSFNMAYWQERASKYGCRAVVNLGHSAEKFDVITKRDENEIFPSLKKLLRGDEKLLLDFGCGSGRFTADLANIIKGKAIGIDPTKTLVDMAPPHRAVEYKVMKEGGIPLSSDSVDVIWIYGVLGCIKNAALAKTLIEIKRVLKPNGLLFLVENTTDTANKSYYVYRAVEDYIKMFPFIALEHIRNYFDDGDNFRERFSIMAGRKKRKELHDAL